MQVTSAHTITTLAAAAVLGAVLAAGAPAFSHGPGGAERQVERQVEQLGQQAGQYVGDPWERRYRAQSWSTQHIHDSWNRCHLGENATRPRGCDGTSLTPRP
jgi:hypothetical protein